ncbi:MAG: FmdB family zinc ribbon protein [Actinomycetota bacterium]
MPTYEYACTDCGTQVEVVQRFGDEPLRECGLCGGRLRKVFHPAGIVFKGSGFYATDSRAASKGKGQKEDASKTAAAGGDAKGEGSKKPDPSKAGSSPKEKTA